MLATPIARVRQYSYSFRSYAEASGLAQPTSRHPPPPPPLQVSQLPNSSYCTAPHCARIVCTDAQSTEQSAVCDFLPVVIVGIIISRVMGLAKNN